MVKWEAKVHKIMETSSQENVTMVRKLKEEVKVHKILEDLFTWKCDNGKNVKGRSKST
jgi:hypothetical protein